MASLGVGPGAGFGAGVRVADPQAPALALLMARHAADMRAETPAESVHMLDAAQLAAPGIRFFALFDAGGAALAMGALKPLDPTHAEIKSMHVLAEHRGQGHARTLLEHLLQDARAAGFARLSLETGVEPIFAPARALYARAGFAECPPFGDYRPDPNSVFMTLTLATP